MRRLLPSLALALVIFVPQHAAASQITDLELAERISAVIRNYPNYGIFDSIDISVDNRAVVLLGRVTAPNKKSEIEARVTKVDGIRSLSNEIGVLPFLPSDQALRLKVAQAIYNHPVFWNFAQMSSPPIHIVVERGQITLTGVADTQMQRQLAFSLAQVSGSFGVTNRIRVDSR